MRSASIVRYTASVTVRITFRTPPKMDEAAPSTRGIWASSQLAPLTTGSSESRRSLDIFRNWPCYLGRLLARPDRAPNCETSLLSTAYCLLVSAGRGGEVVEDAVAEAGDVEFAVLVLAE